MEEDQDQEKTQENKVFIFINGVMLYYILYTSRKQSTSNYIKLAYVYL